MPASLEENMSLEKKIEKLEDSVNKLVAHCKKLSDENDSIKYANKQLLVERSELQAKNDKVRSQVEAMVERLKALDNIG